MKDLLDDPSNVTVLLSIIYVAEFDCAFAGAGVSLKDRGLTLTLCLYVQVHV